MSCKIVRGAFAALVFSGCAEELRSDDGQPAFGGKGELAGTAESALVHFPAGSGATWPRQFGTNVRDWTAAIATDVFGKVFVTGGTDGLMGTVPGAGSYGASDFFLAEFHGTGAPHWLDTQGTTSEDGAHGAAADLSGRYIVGYTLGNLDGVTNAGGGDMFVTKVSPVGFPLWTRLLGSSAFDVGRGVAISKISSDIFVAGSTNGSVDGFVTAGGTDALLVKYDTNGNRQWTRQFGTSGHDSGIAVTSGVGGTAYVAGITTQGLDGNSHAGNNDVFVIKYGSTGNKLWTRQIGTSAHDNANQIAADSLGNVYVVGDTAGALDGQANAGSSDAFVTKYNAEGVKQWTRLFGSAGDDHGRGVCVDPSDNVYVAGRAAGGFDGQAGAGSTDAFLVKFSPTGSKLWTRLYGSSANDWGEAVTWLSGGGGTGGGGSGGVGGGGVGGVGGGPYSSALVAGTTYGAVPGRINFGERDVFIVRYDSGGNPVP